MIDKVILINIILRLAYGYRPDSNNIVVEDGFATYESNSVAYTAAIIRKNSFLTAGALISEYWVLTDGNELYTLKEVKREIKVRVGSTNYKSGGQLIPVKNIEIHPKFNDTYPECDLALVQLAHKISSYYNVKPIKLQRRQKDIHASHFIVTYWSVAHTQSPNLRRISSLIEEQRLLQSSHLHPGDKRYCAKYLKKLKVRNPKNLMCLDPAVIVDPCARETWHGAPVVLDGVLRGITSSWMPHYCDVDTSILVNMVSSKEIFRWISKTVNLRDEGYGDNENFS